MHADKLDQAAVYEVLPPTIATNGYVVGFRKFSLLLKKQTNKTVGLWQTT